MKLKALGKIPEKESIFFCSHSPQCSLLWLYILCDKHSVLVTSVSNIHLFLFSFIRLTEQSVCYTRPPRPWTITASTNEHGAYLGCFHVCVLFIYLFGRVWWRLKSELIPDPLIRCRSWSNVSGSACVMTSCFKSGKGLLVS